MGGGTSLHRQWSEEERAKKRAAYARDYSTGHAGRAQSITIPDDVTVREETFPCTYCGVRADVPCKHRPWLSEAA